MISWENFENNVNRVVDDYTIVESIVDSARFLVHELQVAQHNPLLICVYPASVVYCDRRRYEAGDYAVVARLPYASLRLEWAATECQSADLHDRIQAHASSIISRRGQQFAISDSGQTVTLGG